MSAPPTSPIAMASERRGGPISMSEDELADFLTTAPSGAIGVVDGDGHLLALPSRVVNFDESTLTVAVGGVVHDAAQGRETPACVVVDTFTAYHAIRGLIAQGMVSQPAVSPDATRLAITRIVTFSFANA